MAFTADLGTDIGKVRMLIWDMDSTKPILPDDTQVQALLDMEGSVKAAASMALRMIAANRALTLQVIQILDLKTDGVSVAKMLMAVADAYLESDNDWVILFAETVDNSAFALREKYWKMYIQASGGVVL